MATEIVYEEVPKLDYIDRYKELMEVSLSDESAFLAAKEIIEDLVSSNELTAREKAEIVSKTVGDIATSITTNAMQLAYQASVEERNAKYVVTKLREDMLLAKGNADRMDKEVELVQAQKDQIAAEIIAAHVRKQEVQLKMLSEYGLTSIPSPTDNIDAANATVKGNNSIYAKKINLEDATIYDKWATTYRQNGHLWFNSNGEVLTSVVDAGDPNDELTKGLIYNQSRVAVRQYNGFDDNMRQHVVNASSSMVSMMLANSDAVDASKIVDAYQKWSTGVEYLNNRGSTEALPELAITLVNYDEFTDDAISNPSSDGISIGGFCTNFPAGANIYINLVKVDTDDTILDTVYDTSEVPGIVAIDGTWTAKTHILYNKASSISNGDWKIVVSIKDNYLRTVKAYTEKRTKS